MAIRDSGARFTMIPESVKTAISQYLRGRRVEQEGRAQKEAAAKILLQFFATHEDLPSLSVDGVTVTLVQKTLDEFDAPGLYSRLRKSGYWSPEIRALFSVTVDSKKLLELIGLGVLPRKLVKPYWKIRNVRPYVSVVESPRVG